MKYIPIAKSLATASFLILGISFLSSGIVSAAPLMSAVSSKILNFKTTKGITKITHKHGRRHRWGTRPQRPGFSASSSSNNTVGVGGSGFTGSVQGGVNATVGRPRPGSQKPGYSRNCESKYRGGRSNTGRRVPLDPNRPACY